jgi:hypothetical protein
MFAVKAFSKEAAYSQEKGKVVLYDIIIINNQLINKIKFCFKQK